MKTFRTRGGRFAERPHFEPGEIERMCIDELRKAGCLPATPEPIRVDRYIEKRFKITPEYDDLPEGVLGYTRFSKSGVDAIVVSKALDTEGGKVAERRIRTTLAHEGGHALLHAYLFALEGAGLSLFTPETREENKILCRDVQGESGSQGRYDPSRWAEYQANQAIGGLLLPKKLVSMALEPYLVPAGSLGAFTLDEKKRGEAERALADIFDVNPIVARLRIAEIYRPSQNGQPML